jgi:hypothetical protein
MIFPHCHFGSEELTMEILVGYLVWIEELNSRIIGMKLQNLAFFPPQAVKNVLRENDTRSSPIF